MKMNAPLITLREISAETVGAIVKLEVAEDQQNFVASNAVSLAQALFSPEAWYRAIYCGDEPVGFIMLYDEALRPAPPAHPKVGVWRLMVDRRFQGRGIGKAALLQVIEHVRAKFISAKLCISAASALDSVAIMVNAESTETQGSRSRVKSYSTACRYS